MNSATPTQQSAIEHRWYWALLALITLLGAVVRFKGMTAQSLWFDELWSVHFSRPDLPIADIIAKYRGDFHPLIFPLSLHWLFLVFGWTDTVARGFSVVAGILGIPATAWFGRRVAGHRMALAAAAVVAVNPFHLIYSHEVRSYALVYVFAAVSYGALVQVLDRPTVLRVLVYVIASGLALHTHYFAILLICAQLAAAFLVEVSTDRRKPVLGALIFSGGALAIILIPWLQPVLRAAGITRYWPKKPSPFFIFEYLHAYFGGAWLLTVLVVVLLASAPFVLRGPGPGAPRLRKIAAVLALSCLFLLTAAYLRSILIVPMLVARFTMVLLPALVVLVCLVILNLPRRAAAAALAVIVVGSAVQAWHNGFPSRPPKEQWREALTAALDDADASGGDSTLISALAPGFQFYASMRADEITVHQPSVEILAKIVDNPGADGIWLLVARGRRPNDETTAFLNEHFRRIAVHRFFKTSAEYWQAID